MALVRSITGLFTTRIEWLASILLPTIEYKLNPVNAIKKTSTTIAPLEKIICLNMFVFLKYAIISDLISIPHTC